MDKSNHYIDIAFIKHDDLLAEVISSIEDLGMPGISFSPRC